MFGLTNKISQKQQEENKNDNTLSLSQQKDFNIDDMPIHTMREDLENPNSTASTMLYKPEAARPTQPNLSQKQKSSPFLSGNENMWNTTTLKKETESRKPEMTKEINLDRTSGENKEKEFVFAKVENKTMPAMTPKMPGQEAPLPLPKNQPAPKANLRMLSFSLISLILIAALGWLGYSYLKNRSELQKQPITVEPTVETPIETPKETPLTEPVHSFSEINPNYLRIEDGKLTAEKVKATMTQVSQEGYIIPIEFIITDIQNKPLTFSGFAGLLGIKLSPSISSSLGDNFSLFIYNDTTGPRIGLEIESKNDVNLGKAILSEEKTLANEISPLFFTSAYKTEKLFATSSYLDAKIRFQNIISPDMLSVDYTVYKNKLLIGTTKLTLRSIIDKRGGIKNETTTPPPAETPVMPITPEKSPINPAQ